jgi:hypothetical protein
MTIHQKPRDVLPAFRQKLLPPKRMSEADSLLLEIRDKIAKAQNITELRKPLRTLLGDSLHELNLEETSRTSPGLIGIMHPDDCEFASITE